jgi:hypothetical protein
MMKAWLGAGLLVAAVMLGSGVARAQTNLNSEFVKRDGTKLTLGGKTFRFGGANIEWLGLEAYGPLDKMGPRYPSHFEVDDALDTAKMMGARVVRSQTMGDSIGCRKCIEPKLGEFNPRAFKALDYTILEAHQRGLRLIVTLAGDCAYCVMSGTGEYFKDMGLAGYQAFFTDPKIIARFEQHIAAVLNHRNSLTGIPYKDDPTIMAWENCNMCGIYVALGAPGHSLSPYIPWVDTIGQYIKSIDTKHLYEDNSGFLLFDKTGEVLETKTPDIITSEYYPHWARVMGLQMTVDTFKQDADRVTSHGKVYVVNEYGWDATDWPTQPDFQKVLMTFEDDPKISGDLYWALQAHENEFGWQPIPANVPNKAYSEVGESGQWWAFYYGGLKTLINTKADMAERGEMLRRHAFTMAGETVPPHMIPPAPMVTVKGLGVLAWRGSAGAVSYSIERQDQPGAPWESICDKCATDADTPWVDPKPSALFTVRYRVTAYNADGKASAASEPR